MSFLPQDYVKPEKKSRYYKFQSGDNKFRILSPAIVGWEDWNDKQPVRTHEEPEQLFNPQRPSKHFWAFIIWDYRDEEIKILEITQATIQDAIYNLHNEPDWGNPTNYDVNVKKTGEKMETKYNVVPTPPKLLPETIKELYRNCGINLDELFKGGDPFNSTEKVSNEVETSDIPF
jgi:hypothetical protein